MGGEQKEGERSRITPRCLTSATGWLWCRFGVGMAEEDMSLTQEGDRKTERTGDSAQGFMWQPHS